MKHRILGRTGLKVSEIGYGAEHLEGKPFEQVDSVINSALDGGINIMDVFMPQSAVRSNVGRALGSRRKDVILQGHIGACLQDDGQYIRSRDPKLCEIFIKDFLARLDTDYIDIGMMHFIDTEDDYKEAFESPYIEYVQQLKKDGVIRHIGVSTHDAGVGIKMVNTGLIDVVMFSINPAFDLSPGMSIDDAFNPDFKLKKLKLDPVRAEFYSLCAAKNIGITVMKTLGGGRLLKTETSGLGYAMSLPQCVAYALDRPAVASVLLGAQTADEVAQALAYVESTPAERDYTLILESGLPLLEGKCMYCNHCLPCPQGIDIAAVTKYLDMAKASDQATIRAHYNALPVQGSACSGCGSCEKLCPFKIHVAENMKEAARIFGK